MHIGSTFSTFVRPILRGERGAIAAAHPLAVAAGQQMLTDGGSAVDAAIAAQAVLCVVMPDACGLGGDMFALIADSDRGRWAVNAAGAAPAGLDGPVDDGGRSVTLPGIVAGWEDMAKRWGRLPFASLFTPAIRLAREGFRPEAALMLAVAAQRTRLEAGGAGEWALLHLGRGDRLMQEPLGGLLEAIAQRGATAFYGGEIAQAICRSVQRGGGCMTAVDMTDHRTHILAPITTLFGDVSIDVQPPMAQGILLSMALGALEHHQAGTIAAADHCGIELTEAAFAYRNRVAEGERLLDEVLKFDPRQAARRGGPRAYLHTAGVATVDASGLVVSSLSSVFDDFGSAIFVPEGGFVLNNRAAGFTTGANAAQGGKRPVHTLAPALVRGDWGTLALATPGADGQIQTLLQVIVKTFSQGVDLAEAIAAPRWRSENGSLLIEEGHPGSAELERRGHRLVPLKAGDMRFGSIVCSGFVDGLPIAGADWRRQAWSGVC